MFLLSALIAQCAQWDEIVRATTDHAPYGFVRYWSSPGSRMMHAAGHHGCASSYLIGNYELAEQMYRHDAAATLHAPLRLVVHQQQTTTAMLSFSCQWPVISGTWKVGVMEPGLGGTGVKIMTESQ